MRFTHPEFLYALTAVLIPVIIHLFNFRRYRKLLFSNISFLKNITLETKKQNKLKHLLVLLARILFIVFAVTAFSGPYFPGNTRTGMKNSNTSLLYLDNSYSMKAEGAGGRLMDEIRKDALDLVKKLPKNERFSLMTNNPGTGNGIFSRTEVIPEIEKTVTGRYRKSLSTVIRQQKRLAEKKGRKPYKSFLFSDFQKNQSDFENIEFDTSAFYYFIPAIHKTDHNLYIDSCWFERPVLLPGKQLKLLARVLNSSSSDVKKISIKLFVDGKQKALAGFDVAANDFTVIPLGFTVETEGWHTGKVQIEDFPITFDDKMLFSFRIRDKINVLELLPEKFVSPDYCALFYNSDSVFRFASAKVTELNNFNVSDFDLLILNRVSDLSGGLINLLFDFTKQGGRLLVIPPADKPADKINNLLKRFAAGSLSGLDTVNDRVVTFKKNSLIFKKAIRKIPPNADLPLVHKHYRLRYGMQSGMETFIGLLNGDDLISAKLTGSGKLFVLTSPLKSGFTNFMENPLFTVFMYGIATEGIHSDRLYFISGRDNRIVLDGHLPQNPDLTAAMETVEGENRFIPMQQRRKGKIIISPGEGIENEGFYKIVINDSLYRLIAVNINRKESEMRFFSPDEIDSILQAGKIKNYQIADNPEAVIRSAVQSTAKSGLLSKLFIIFALFMLLTEIVLLRFWK